MKQKFSRLLCLVLCAFMVPGLLPAMAVSGEAQSIDASNYEYLGESEDGWTFYTVDTESPAENTSGTELTISTGGSHKTVKTIIKDEQGDITFTTFEDLKYLAGQSHSAGTQAVYTGTGDFVISEDLTIPKNLELYFYDHAVTVPEGITFTLKGSAYFDNLTVNGTLSGYETYIEKSLTVNGSFACQSKVTVSTACTVSGMEKITYKNSQCKFVISYRISDRAALLSGLETAAAQTNSRIAYTFDLVLVSDMELTASLTVPENSELFISKDASLSAVPSFILSKDATLTINGYVAASVNLTVNGTLANENYLDILYDDGGILTIGDTGCYTGDGGLYVFASELDAPYNALSGLDTDQFMIELLEAGCWVLYNMEGLTKLPAPTDPQWGVRYTGASDDQGTQIPGFMSWRSSVPNEAAYSVNLYRVEDGSATLVDQYYWEDGSGDASEWISLSAFCLDPLESGDYYFEVKSCGNFVTNFDSDYAVSDVWTYTAPDAQLGSCTELAWIDHTMTWTAPSDSSLVGGYAVDIFYASTETGTPSKVLSCENYSGPELTALALPNAVWNRLGDGYYFFRVRALSADITQAANGSLSAYSPALYLEAPSSGVTRLSGSSRSETAFKAAEELKEVLGVEEFETIILASGDNFADALAGSYLAAVKNAPILLYRKTALAENAAYISENLAQGGTVYILGGTASVSQEMEDALSGLNVKRLAGASRFDTNLEILKEAEISGNEILVATGWNFADCLSASATGKPILLVNSSTNKLTDSQIEYLSGLTGVQITIIGGTASVSEKLAGDLAAYGTVDRVSGATREETSVKVAERYFDSPDYALVAYSRNFPDGLCGGPLAYALNSPLLLTNVKQEAPATAYVADNGITKGIILGGTASIADATVRTVFGLEKAQTIIVK